MSQRNEMRRINEALQFLIRKRTKAKHITEWKIGSQKTFCLNLAFQALEDQTSKLRDSAFMKEMQKTKLEREKESDKAQKMAEEIASNLDGLSEGHSRKSRSIYDYQISIVIAFCCYIHHEKKFCFVNYLFSQLLKAGIMC